MIVIDAQREYVDGKLRLSGVKPALAEIGGLLARAQGGRSDHSHQASRPVRRCVRTRHSGIRHREPSGPAGTEAIIEKSLPNAFAGTTLTAAFEGLGRKQIILTGFMTHMCVEATARAALDHSLKNTVVAAATAKRDLPDPLTEETVPTAEVQLNALAALADRFSTIVPKGDAILD